MAELTGRPAYGVPPYVRGLGIDAEDALDPAICADTAPPLAGDVLRISVIRLPRASNLTDLDPWPPNPA